MKNPTAITTFIAFAFAAPHAHAGHMFEDYARVLEVTAQYEEVNVPREECVSEVVSEPAERRGSVAGPVVGGIGSGSGSGIIGEHAGKGRDRVAASAAGAITGGHLSERGVDEYREREVRHCKTVDHWETRFNGYRVVYRYKGRQQTVVLPYDPGRRLRVRVAVEPAGTSVDNDQRREQ